MLFFSATLGYFLQDSEGLAGCQINPIDVNFHVQKVGKFFDDNSADKIKSKKDKGDKSALPHSI